MGIFSKGKNDGDLMLVFHIGSSAVGGALFTVQDGLTPKITFSVVEPIAIEENLDPDRFFAKTLSALEVAAGKLHKAGLGAPARIFCVLASPWCASQTRTLELKKNAQFVFTEKVADELIKKEIKLFTSEQLSRYGDAVRNIELKNIKTLLNGYDTPEPLYQKTSQVQMMLFISMGGEAALAKIEETIRKFFQFEQIKFSSFAMSSFTVARDLDPKRENFLLVDIGGEVTEIFMVKKNILRESISFPVGRNFFTRGVARSLGSTISEANSLISLFKHGHAEETVAAKLSTIMDQLRAEWLRKFQESLANLSNDISVPGAVYLTSDLNFTDLFYETIKAEQFSQYTLADSKFEITALNTVLLHNFAKFEDESVRDPFLIIDSVYISRFLLKP
ncbi:MAG: cell division protein FtsA [Candidatus Paceibacterota bacterium]|jgi:hypothetical protein